MFIIHRQNVEGAYDDSWPLLLPTIVFACNGFAYVATGCTISKLCYVPRVPAGTIPRPIFDKKVDCSDLTVSNLLSADHAVG